jgi:hypothetical protein
MKTALVAVPATLALLATVSGCERALHVVSSAQNQAPEVRLSPPGTPLAGSADIVHTLAWTGVDHDGRIDHYLVAVNPRSLDRVDGWQSTLETRRALHVMKRTAPLSGRLAPGRAADAPTIVAVRAVDDRGATSDPATRAFFGANVAPSVAITHPQPSALITLSVPPTLRIDWQGIDPDGVFTQKPVKYKFKLLAEGNPEFPINIARIDPDSLRRFYEPSFTSWDSVAGDTTTTTFTNLVVNQMYLFAITAFDEAGDYDPVFDANKNLLFFRVATPGTLGPRITMYNESFNYSYPSGGFSTDSSREVRLELPADAPVTFHWFAQAALGLDVTGYRWVLDPVSLDDEKPRKNKNDTGHWSPWSLSTTSAALGVFHGQAASKEHLFYVEAMDDLGEISLGIIRFHLVQVRANRQLLIVDDTRFNPDQFVGGSVGPPKGRWPTAAELDTFLYARGGVPWQGYPTGTMSTPGTFDGYDFDTLGTRTGQADATVPLDVLLQYRHVVWIVDPEGATFNRSPTDGVLPMTALRFMTAPGRMNTLAAYLERGGHVWLVGGGTGFASTIAWNNINNDRPVITFSSVLNELAPGRLMYDETHWRSSFQAWRVPAQFQRAPFPPSSDDPVPLSLFPAELAKRSPATDPLPPLRTPSQFYTFNQAVEFLNAPNAILEDKHPTQADPSAPSSTLDTVYVVVSPLLPEQGPDPAHDRIVNPCMTWYHGRDNGSLMFTGFEPWAFSRANCVQLIDGVLGGVWHLSRSQPAVVLAPPSPVQDPVVEANVARRP